MLEHKLAFGLHYCYVAQCGFLDCLIVGGDFKNVELACESF